MKRALGAVFLVACGHAATAASTRVERTHAEGNAPTFAWRRVTPKGDGCREQFTMFEHVHRAKPLPTGGRVLASNAELSALLPGCVADVDFDHESLIYVGIDTMSAARVTTVSVEEPKKVVVQLLSDGACGGMARRFAIEPHLLIVRRGEWTVQVAHSTTSCGGDHTEP